MLLRAIVFGLAVALSHPLGLPAQPRPPARRLARDVSGWWYASGNRRLPCYIMVFPNGQAVFTNENGDTSGGRVFGDVVVADDWGLQGQVVGNIIYWENRSVWTR